MENEKKNKAKKIISEVVYGSIMVVLLAWAMVAGYHQAKSSDKMLERLSHIEEKLNNSSDLLIHNEQLARYDSTISDLTGTSWIINNAPQYSPVAAYHVNYVAAADTANTNEHLELNLNYIDIGSTIFFEGFYPYYSALSFRNYNNEWFLYDDSEESYYDDVAGDLVLTFTGGDDVANNGLISWLLSSATQTGDSEPVAPAYKPIRLNTMYDMRQWFGQVDAMSGCVILSSNPSISTPLIYEIGDVEINGVHYTHLGLAFGDMRGANIVVGYDFTNNTYLISTGAEYAPDAAYILGLLKVSLLTGNSFLNNQELNLYKAPMVGGLSRYSSGGIINSTGTTATSGLLLSQFKLNAMGCDWSNYQPSNTKYSFIGLGSAQFSIYELLQMDYLNDTYMDFYAVGSQATGGSVFTLIGNAFATLVPILSIQVIPGLPIGLLVCLPIVATIIVVVFKIVRK